MLNMPILKFDKSIKYLETQINIQQNNKQLILDIITNIGLILNTSSTNDNEHLKNVLDTANDFLQNISNNIITLEQLNLEISNITKELNDIISSKSQTPKTKEYYIAAFSNIKNNIEQYTESFQEVEKKLDIDNNDFNNFIKENDFKYTFTEDENSENNYELESFSVNNEVTSIYSETDTEDDALELTNNEDIQAQDTISSEVVEPIVEDEVIVETVENNVETTTVSATEISNEVTNESEPVVEENIVNDLEPTVEENIDETISNEETQVQNESEVIVENEITPIETQEQNSNNTDVINENDLYIEEIPSLSINDINSLSEKPSVELDPAELEKSRKIDELTNEFKEILTNLYDTGITNFDLTSALTNSFQEILPSATKSDTDIDLELLEEIDFSDDILNGIATVEEPSTDDSIDELVYETPSLLEDTIVDDIVEEIIEEAPMKNNLLESLIEKDSSNDTIIEDTVEDSLLGSLIKENSINEEPVSEIEIINEEVAVNEEITSDSEDVITEEIIETTDEDILDENIDINDIIDESITVEDIIEESTEQNEEIDIVEEPVEQNEEIIDIVDEPIEQNEEIIDIVEESIEQNEGLDIIEDEVKVTTVDEAKTESDIEDHGLPELDDSILEEIFSPKEPEVIVEEITSPLEEISYTEDILNNELTNLLNDEFDETVSDVDNELLQNAIVEESLIPSTPLQKVTIEKTPVIKNEAPRKIQKVIDETLPINEMIDMIKSAEAKSKVLIISEKTNSIYLPYRLSELRNYMEYYPNVYDSLADVVNQEFIINLDNIREHPSKSRFSETYNLLKRSGKTSVKALARALKLSNMKNLDPAIIAACKSEYELDCFLDCLNHNKLDSFKFFKIFYDTNPV